MVSPTTKCAWRCTKLVWLKRFVDWARGLQLRIEMLGNHDWPWTQNHAMSFVDCSHKKRNDHSQTECLAEKIVDWAADTWLVTKFNTGLTADRKGGRADCVQKTSRRVFLVVLKKLRTEIAPRADCQWTENFVEGFLGCAAKKKEELPTNRKPCGGFCGLSSWHASHDWNGNQALVCTGHKTFKMILWMALSWMINFLNKLFVTVLWTQNLEKDFVDGALTNDELFDPAVCHCINCQVKRFSKFHWSQKSRASRSWWIASSCWASDIRLSWDGRNGKRKQHGLLSQVPLWMICEFCVLLEFWNTPFFTAVEHGAVPFSMALTLQLWFFRSACFHLSPPPWHPCRPACQSGALFLEKTYHWDHWKTSKLCKLCTG